MRVSIVSISVLMVAALVAPLSEPVFAAQVSIKRSIGGPVPEHIEQLAGELSVAAHELNELAVDGALPVEWIPVLRNAFALGEAAASGLELNAGQRVEFAGQITNTLVRIEREARKPRKASFAELIAGVRSDACQTIRANLGDSAAAAATSLLQELTPLQDHP